MRFLKLYDDLDEMIAKEKRLDLPMNYSSQGKVNPMPCFCHIQVRK